MNEKAAKQPAERRAKDIFHISWLIELTYKDLVGRNVCEKSDKKLYKDEIQSEKNLYKKISLSHPAHCVPSIR